MTPPYHETSGLDEQAKCDKCTTPCGCCAVEHMQSEHEPGHECKTPPMAPPEQQSDDLLLIGGRLDGQRVSANPDLPHALTLPILHPSSFHAQPEHDGLPTLTHPDSDREEYALMTIMASGAEFRYYRHKPLSNRAAIRMLLQGYRSPRIP